MRTQQTAGDSSPVAQRSGAAETPQLLARSVFGCEQAKLDRAALLSALDISSEAVMICSCATTPPCVIYVNASFQRLTGYSAGEVCGQPYDSRLRKSPERCDMDFVTEAIQIGGPVTAVIRCMHRAGAELQIELTAAPTLDTSGRVSCYVMVFRDLTQSRHHVEHLRYIANHDTLTGLPNRRLLLDRLDQALARYRRNSEAFALAFVDLNELKYVNDHFGHSSGDEILKHVSKCLASSIRQCDTVARYGGDEFVLLLTESGGSDTARQILARALRCLDRTLTLGGRPYKPTCSIGVAMCPRDGTDVLTLLDAADEAMYRAKTTDRTLSSVHGLNLDSGAPAI